MIRNVFIYTLLSLGFLGTAFGQSTDNSPYSRLGLGDLTSSSLNGLYIMGDLGSSFVSTTALNPVNPGSYGFLDYTVFDVGLYAKYTSLSDQNNNDRLWSGNLEYFSLGFPLRNINNEIFDKVDKPYKWGMNFMIKPFSTVNYSIFSSDSIPEVGTIERQFEGNGGTYTLNWGTGYRYKNFGVGANVGFLFGNISNEQYIDVPSDDLELIDIVVNNYNIRGFVYDVGLIYRLQINKAKIESDKSVPRKNVTFGLRGSSATPFATDQEYLHMGRNATIVLIDTLDYQANVAGSGNLPATVGFGAYYTSGVRVGLGVDFEYSNWSNYSNDARPNQDLTDSYKISVGGSYLPDDRGFGNFFERTTYKYGIYYRSDPRTFDNKNLTQYGVTLGMSMPFFYQKSFSRINLGADFGRKGIGSPIEENYVQIKLGINFNDDQWFLKTRYN